MERVLDDKEDADVASRFFTFILMDLVEHELLTPSEAERARRIYSEMIKKGGSASKGCEAKQD